MAEEGRWRRAAREENGMKPSMSEVAVGSGISTGTPQTRGLGLGQ